MKKVLIILLVISALSRTLGIAQRPEGFSWVNPESDKATITIVRRALKINLNTTIQKVGIMDGFALVMTKSKEPEMQTRDSDRWSIYSLSLATGKSQILVSGYRVKMLGWVGLTSPELAISYYDCWECEAATLFTTLHYTKSAGWNSRWANKKADAKYPHPGAVVSYGDAGEPYDDDDVDQVFALILQPEGSFAAGSWFHSRNTKTGKVEDDVEKYSIDSTTGEDRFEKLMGVRSLEWRRKLCTQQDNPIRVNTGQSSKSCRRLQAPQSVPPR